MRPRLLFTAFDVVPAPKGASVRIQHTLKALSQRFEVHAVLLGEPGYEEQIHFDGVLVERLVAPATHFLEKTKLFADKVLQKVQDWQPEFIQFRSLWDGFALAQRKAFLPQGPTLIYELHGLPEYELEHHYSFLPESILEKIKQQQVLTLQAADYFICPSEQHINHLQAQGISPDKVFRVGNGVDLQRFQPDPQQEEPGKVLYIGTLAPWQGLETLIEALPLLKSYARVQVVGKGNPRWQRDLITKAYQLGVSHAFEILNPLSHEAMPALLQTAEVVVAPLDDSHRNCVQGCDPIKIFEYMACGKAILASDLPVINAILNDQKNALLFGVNDAQSLAEKMDLLLQNQTLRQTLGEQARKTAQEKYSWEQMHLRLNQVYQTITQVQRV